MFLYTYSKLHKKMNLENVHCNGKTV